MKHRTARKPRIQIHVPSGATMDGVRITSCVANRGNALVVGDVGCRVTNCTIIFTPTRLQRLRRWFLGLGFSRAFVWTVAAALFLAAKLGAQTVVPLGGVTWADQAQEFALRVEP